MRTSHPVIKFKLMTSKTGKDGFAPIFLYVQFHGRAVMSTGQRCRPDRFSAGMCTDPAVRLALEAMRNRVERARLLLDLSGDAYDARALLARAFPPEPVQQDVKRSYRSLMEAALSRRQSAPKTRQLHEYAYGVMCAFMKRKDFSVEDLDEAAVSRWIRSVQGKWRPLSIKSVLSKVNDMWNEFIRQGGSSKNYPFNSIRISSFKGDKEKQVLDEGQVKALFRYFDSIYDEGAMRDRNSRVYALGAYLFGYMSFGLALVDILKLKADAVVEDEGGWTVSGVCRSKTAVPVPIYIIRCPFTEKIMPLLVDSSCLRDGYLFPGIQNDRGLLLCDTPERITAQVSNMVRIVNRNLKHIWREVNRLYGVGIPETYTFYSMRSSAASVYLHQQGANIYSLAHLMGRGITGIETYVQSILSTEELMAERRKLLSPGTYFGRV